MHRSGTSALTRILGLCGARLPNTLVPFGAGRASDSNSISGFWESTPLVLLNDEALSSIGSGWDASREVPPEWFQSDACRDLTKRLSDLIESEFGDAPLFVAKDPRTSLLVPMWVEALRALDVTANWIVSVRNPLEVAASLNRRDGFSLPKGLRLWLRHVLALERDTRHQERLFVGFEELLADWRKVISRAEVHFSFKFPNCTSSIVEEVEQFLSVELRHHTSSASELEAREDVPDEVKETFRWIMHAVAGYEGDTARLDMIHRALPPVDPESEPLPESGSAAAKLDEESEPTADSPAPDAAGADSAQPDDSVEAGHDAAASTSRIKTIAFYLPQFHPIPENDEWWGKGFTEWANVTRAEPCFRGHAQPNLPSELGFYDLRLPEVQLAQAALAREHGIHGFCYYYYWFNGKKLLSRPLETMLVNREPDFPFCICWANENWTRRWDGESDRILIAQEHSPDSDARFIRDVMPVLLDPRYIRLDGKPVLLVYRADLLADPAQTAARWRDAAQGAGLPGLHLCAVWKVDDPRPIGFDALVEFPPHEFFHREITDKVRDRSADFRGRVYDYAAGAAAVSPLPEKGFPIYRGVMPSWDNTPRRGPEAHIFANSTPAIYRTWLARVAREALSRPGKGDQFVFINAWNEWAEGATLEPSRKHGRAYLEATRDALQRARCEPSDDEQIEFPAENEPLDDSIAPSLTPVEEHEISIADFAPMPADGEQPRYWTSPVYGALGLVAKAPLWLVTGRLPSRLRWWRQMRQILRSGLFDSAYYRTVSCPDVDRLGIDPLYHFVRYGAAAGLAPNPSFSTAKYLELHPEVNPSVENPLLHAFGRDANDKSAGTELWLNRNFGLLPLLAKAPAWLVLGRLELRMRWWGEMRRLFRSGAFNAHAYRLAYPEVASLNIDPLYHYVRYGAAEGRSPNPSLQLSGPDRDTPVAMAGADDGGRRRGGPADARWAPPATARATATQWSPTLPVRGIRWNLNTAHAKSRGPGSRALLVVSHDAARAGAQLLLLEVVKRLAEATDLEIYLLFLGRGELEGDFRQVVHTLQLEELTEGTGGRSEAAIDAIVADFAMRKPMMALCNTVVSSHAAIACKRYGIPVLSLVHELPTSIDSTLGSRTIADLVSASRTVIVVSDFVKSALVRSYALQPDRLRILRPSVFDWDRSTGWRERARTRVLAEVGLPDETFLVLGCGWVHSRKGTDLFVQVAREAVAMRGSERMAFIWIGPDQSGPVFRQWCEHDISAAQLQSRVRLLGARRSSSDYFGAADAFALTSREDPFPLVNLEAMSRGLPVVAFDGAGGAPEALEGNAGIVVPYLDVREMARSLVRLCEAPHFHREISENASRRILERHTWSHYMNGLLQTMERDFGYVVRRSS
jgi:hypothetical protein